MAATLDYFHHLGEGRRYASGEVIFRAGERGEAAYVVRTGEVEIQGNGGQVLYVVEPGGVFGEMALIDQEPRSATAVARGACEVVAVDEKRFLFLVQQAPFFSLQVMRVLAERLREMNRRQA